jgi:MFS family permease
VIGRFADRRGRKPAMMLSFSLMGFAIVGLALTPSYAAIGMAAPALAVTFRLLQGFALGGEVGPNTAFLYEAAPPGRRGVYVSLQYASQNLAVLAAGTIGWTLSSLLSSAQLDSWGWRIALLIGATIIPFAIVVRRTLSETLTEARAAEPATGQKVLPVAIGGLLLLTAGTIGYYTLGYLNTYAQVTLGMEVNIAFGATIMLGLSTLVADLGAGWLVDRFGPKRVLLLPWIAMILLAVPAYMVIGELRSAVALLTMTALLGFLAESAGIPSLVLLTEALPARIRAGALGLIYALAISVFGGSAQFVINRLTAWSGDPLAPAWYMTGAMLVGFIGVLLIRERRPRTSCAAQTFVPPVIVPAHA